MCYIMHFYRGIFILKTEFDLICIYLAIQKRIQPKIQHFIQLTRNANNGLIPNWHD